MRDVSPDVKCSCWNPLYSNAETLEFSKEEISFLFEGALQGPGITSNEIQIH